MVSKSDLEFAGRWFVATPDTDIGGDTDGDLGTNTLFSWSVLCMIIYKYKVSSYIILCLWINFTLL